MDPIAGIYIVSRYDDLRDIMLDPDTYSSASTIERVRDTVKLERAKRMRQIFEDKGWLPAPSLSLLDEPRHKEIRRIFDQAFRAGKIKELEPLVRDTALDLVESFANSGTCELVQQFSVPFPLWVIGAQMGAKREDLWHIKNWTDAFIKRLGMMLDDEEEAQSIELEIEAQHYFKPIVDNLRSIPNGTLLSELVNTRMSDGSRLSDNEILSHLMGDIFVGGSETSTNALTAGVLLLCENPGQYRKLQENPDRYMKSFVEEVLRTESPVQGLFRVTQKDVTLHDVAIPKGSLLQLRFGAANRDPRHFPCPHELDLDRDNAGSHLAFGSGTHHCLGAPLARRELYWGFTALIERLDNIRLAPGKNNLTYMPSFFLRSLKDLHIEFERRH